LDEMSEGAFEFLNCRTKEVSGPKTVFRRSLTRTEGERKTFARGKNNGLGRKKKEAPWRPLKNTRRSLGFFKKKGRQGRKQGGRQLLEGGRQRKKSKRGEIPSSPSGRVEGRITKLCLKEGGQKIPLVRSAH